ncbi:FGGY family carbohydrate kinase [Priestia filamentosa]|nr:FGGY family carbohydrate kinase [Priestia filamentosa]
MKKCCLAVDIGASSGRLIASYLKNGQLKLNEIHRFENKIVRKDDQFCWELDRLFLEIKKGIKKCQGKGLKPESIGIDTWAVDFILLDDNEKPLTNSVAYRDSRTDGMMDEVFKIIMKERLYLETGRNSRSIRH